MNRHATQPGRWDGPGDRRPTAGRATPSLADLRPSSPGQLALIGGGLWLAGMLIPMLGFFTLVGVALVAVAGVTYFMRPKSREMYWRGRRIEVGGEPTWGERLYRTLYRR
jgi:hypothetical protein